MEQPRDYRGARAICLLLTCNPDEIQLFVTSGVLMILFVAWATYLGKAAIVPLRLLRNRTVVGASFAGFFSAIGLMCVSYLGQV